MNNTLSINSTWASEEIGRWMNENLESLSGSFSNAFAEVLAQFRSGKRQEDLCYVYISFLRSAVLTGLPWLQIDLYGAEERSSPCECSVKWEIAVPFSYCAPYHNDIPHREINAILERESLLLENAELFFQGLFQHIPHIVGEARNNLGHPQVRWYYGEYLGEVKEIG